MLNQKARSSLSITATKLFVLSLLGAAFVVGAQAEANPTISENWRSYTVRGTSPNQILKEMDQKGPNGFWAYTRWYVRWSGNCRVTLQIDYTMPRHTNRNAMTPSVRQRWDGMIYALRLHEQTHGSHGIRAAQELVARNCRNGNAIVKKWADQDVIFDQRTNHGRREGVVFP